MAPDLGHQVTDQKLEKLEKRISKVYKEARDDLDKTITAYFAAFEKRDAEMRDLIGQVVNGKEWTEQDYKRWRLNQIGRGKRYQALRDRVAERMTNAKEVAIAYVNDDTPGVYSLNRNYTAYTIEQVSGDVGFDLWDEQTVKRLISEEPDLMPYYPPKKAVKRGIDLAWGKKQITKSVTSGLLQGKSVGKIATDLQSRVNTMSRDSAIRAARTAITGAQNAGRMDGYVAAQKMGIELEREWVATLDNRTRHEHAMMDGQKAPIDKPFKMDGYNIMYPGDMSAPGYLVYNCRCTLIAAINGVDTSDVLRRDKNGLVPNMTFAQWEASKRGYSAAPISRIRDKEVIEWYRSFQNQQNIAILKEKITSGEISTKIRPQQQKKHIEGTPQFEQYKESRRGKGQTPQSILTISEAEAQELVKKYSCTGNVEIKKAGKNSLKIIEYCNSDSVVGQFYCNDAYHDTKRFCIFYSKRGTHVVPTQPKEA